MKPVCHQPDPEADARSVDPARRTREQQFDSLNLLSSSIAHEFNNIIAGILGSAELAGMDMHEGHPAHEPLKQIYEASGRARDFIYKIRAFSQRPPVERRPVALPTVIEESLQILRGVIPEKVGLHTAVQPGCPPVEVDAAQLQQVLIDLCVFCWQGLLDRRGAITIALASRPVSDPSPALAPGQYACLTIHDDSVGLEEAALKKVFNPFHTRKTSKKIGMELFLARETILAHQGDLTVQSPPGQGLTFQILLPVMNEA